MSKENLGAKSDDLTSSRETVTEPLERSRKLLAALADDVEIQRQYWADIEQSVLRLEGKFGLTDADHAIIIDPSKQLLHLVRGRKILKTYVISTAKNGMGSRRRSGRTPTGTHRIREKIGHGAALGTIFKSRVNTGRKAEIRTDYVDVKQDEVTTRIMWLDGQEQRVNKGRGIDSHSRYIYIHGTPEEGLLGEPASHGCIRMSNSEVVELYDLVPPGTLIEIQDKPVGRLSDSLDV
jgi:lipoprotein-anchoring transpeptidase ErfK/SrfK